MTLVEADETYACFSSSLAPITYATVELSLIIENTDCIESSSRALWNQFHLQTSMFSDKS